MNISYSDSFKKAVKTLNVREKSQLKSKLQLFAENPRHPSLRSKKMTGREDIFESSINMDIRITWQYCEDGVLLRNIGHHNDALSKP